MVRNKTKKAAEGTVQPEPKAETTISEGTNPNEPEITISDTIEADVKPPSIVERLQAFLQVLQELEQLVESTAPKNDKLMGSRFMKNRLRHQIEDLQRSLEKFVVQMEMEA